MNVQDFVLSHLQKGPQTTEELASILPLDKASRLGKTLATLERKQLIYRVGEDPRKNVWALC